MSKLTLIAIAIALVFTASSTQAQTSSFTYQGRLTDNGTTANGAYEMQFRLFNNVTGGSQVGSTITNSAVNVSNGVFTVQLDYGAAAFGGADRYLEIGVRPAGDSNAYTILNPRQQLTSAVYAIRAGSATNADSATSATNSTQLGGVNANQYVQTSDARLTDARTPTAGSSNYIQNSLNQQTANFNVSGNGTAGGTLSANSVNTATDFKIGGNSVLSLSGIGSDANSNTFTGISAGAATTPQSSGGNNFLGTQNSFFGHLAGKTNTTGYENSFFGDSSGALNTIGFNNAFFGYTSGVKNTQGVNNTFVGSNSGDDNTIGSSNTFLGAYSGGINKSGNELTLIGVATGVGSDNLKNATAVGSSAYVTQSNSLVLGSIQNVNNSSDDTNVGIGTTAPKSRLHIQVNGNSIHLGDAGCLPGLVGLGFGTALTNCKNYSLVGDGVNTFLNRPTGGTLYFSENGNEQLSIAPGGAVRITNFVAGGASSVCRNASNQLAACSSSLRYKTNIQAFTSGLQLLRRLRPISFDWKDGGMHDLGFGAEDIAAVEPLLVTRNEKGEVEGVKYDRITAVLVNAVKEQQEQIRQQQEQITSLKRLVCAQNRRASVCKR